MTFDHKGFSLAAFHAFPSVDVDEYIPEFGATHLRFELGLGHPNGSNERVSQSAERAAILFDECNLHHDNIVVIANVLHCELGNLNEKWNHHLRFLSNGIAINGLVRDLTYIEEDENDVEQEFPFRQLLFRARSSDLDYRAIFQGIANLEQGKEPIVCERIYFYNEDKSIVFYMYDDRGCLIWSAKPETLAFLYSKYNNWLVENHRKHFDSIWGM